MNATEQKARELGAELVRIWENWSDENEHDSEIALRDTAKEVRALDLHHVDGVLASPLNYFVRSHLDDENPEDLTISEMIESIKISLSLLNS